MKMLCPKCNSHVDCENDSRFRIYECDNCKHHFRGIHANVDKANKAVRMFARFFIPLFHEFIDRDTLDDDATCCPFCWTQIQMTKSNDKGYRSPPLCYNCRSRLPIERI